MKMKLPVTILILLLFLLGGVLVYRSPASDDGVVSRDGIPYYTDRINLRLVDTLTDTRVVGRELSSLSSSSLTDLAPLNAILSTYPVSRITGTDVAGFFLISFSHPVDVVLLTHRIRQLSAVKRASLIPAEEPGLP